MRQVASALPREKTLSSNIKKESEDAVLASNVLCEMVTKSSCSFTEGTFIADCMVTSADILCPEKKLFEGISLTANAVASRVDELTANSS